MSGLHWSGSLRRHEIMGHLVLVVAALLWLRHGAEAADPDVLRPRVPADQLEITRSVVNPLPPAPDHVERGKALYLGKAFCAACHGKEGKGLGTDLDLKGPLPRNFTDRAWQAARTDGEIMWILKNGSPGTDMAPFIPLVLTEEEAWQVLLYIRSFGDR